MAVLLTASVLGQGEHEPKLILALWLGLMATSSLIRFFTIYRIGTTGEQLTAGLRERLYQHLRALPWLTTSSVGQAKR